MKAKYSVLCENNAFRRAYGRGKCYLSPLAAVYVLPTRGRDTRIGITVSKKIGGAVSRNRVKRIIRAALREITADWSRSRDIVIVARARALGAKSSAFAAELTRLFKEAEIK